MKRSFFYKMIFVTLGLGAGGLSWGNLTPPTQKADLDLEFTEAELNQRAKILNEKVSEYEAQLREKTKIYHSLLNGATSPQFAWEDDEKNTGKRSRLQNLLKISIRENIHQIDFLRGQQKDLQSEKEWLQIQMSEVLKIGGQKSVNPLSVASRSNFHCAAFPLQGNEAQIPQLLQDFGSRKDEETGLEWRSLGWWFTSAGREVRSCAAGRVAYTGSVSGRGRVLMIDHGRGVMTLYANLNEDAGALRLKKGEPIQSGQNLGLPLERFYFEVRQNGVAVNPRLVLSTQNLSQLGIQGL